MYKVAKKDGSFQDFDRNKIINALTNAGTSPEAVESIVREVEAWLPLVVVDNTVGYQELKEKVNHLLTLSDIEAAQRFQSYKKN